MQIFCMCIFKQSALIPFSKMYDSHGGGDGGSDGGSDELNAKLGGEYGYDIN